MKSKGLNELRESYLSFFESKGHIRMASAPLIPQGDNSLLLINSGMAPLKKYFLGTETPPGVRVTTCQKCIRTPDIERVGKTSRHGTYFEMLGNFSFGDYFKIDAIKWAWEYFTKVLEMPESLLHISVYEEDDEAYDIWTKTIGIDPSHMVRLGKEDNFWEHGEGPCGPCSEIYFDRGADKGCGAPDCHVGCDCDRFVEVWNLVFSQFDSDGKGHYTEMKSKNIDTGMGLERLACVMQGVDNLFEVDTVRSIMKHICRVVGVNYKENEKADVSLRVITDHIRSTVFMVGDGVIPSNEGRGYVLRRLIRRAARHAKLLGFNRLFLSEIADTVIAENAAPYPELAEKQSYIKKIIFIEEEKFSETINRGLELLNEMIKASKDGVLSGDDAFKLSDTYGFPLDLTIEISEEQGLKVDEPRFRELAKIQAETARADRKEKSNSSWEEGGLKLDLPKTEFVGYEHLWYDSKVIYIAEYEDGKYNIILDKTLFYAESGGQAADHGFILNEDYEFEVNGVGKTPDGLIIHDCTPVSESGKPFSAGDIVSARVDIGWRRDTMKNHTAAHLLQYALRDLLGDHVHQAGQLVNYDFCRFDFTHFEALSKDDLSYIEDEINSWIQAAIPVDTREMPIAEAKKLGATALFSEKYGETVRVVSAEAEDSNLCPPLGTMELCGGTHVKNTAEIGGFKIISENSVANGVRRITAITGRRYREMFDKNYTILQDITAKVKLQTADEIGGAIDKLHNEIKAKERVIAAFEEKSAGSKVDDLLKSATIKDGIKLISAQFDGMDFESLRKLGDSIKSHTDVAALITNGEKLVAVCGKDAVSAGFKAGDIVKTAAAVCGGKGGGKPDSATAGVGDREKLSVALKTLLA
jgi:alanyl-tRNA synthetase